MATKPVTASAAKAAALPFIDPAAMPDPYALTGSGTCMEPLFLDGSLGLLHLIERYCRAHGIAPTTFGRLALRDPQFVHDVQRRGRTPRPATVSRVLQFIESLEA